MVTRTTELAVPALKVAALWSITTPLVAQLGDAMVPNPALLWTMTDCLGVAIRE